MQKRARGRAHLNIAAFDLTCFSRSLHSPFSRSYNASANAIRSRTFSPPSRLVTWASDKKVQDVCLGIADVISFNSYPAW